MKTVCCCISHLVSQQGRVAAGDSRETLRPSCPCLGRDSAVSREGPGPSPALAGPVSPAQGEGAAGGAVQCRRGPAEVSAAPRRRARCSLQPPQPSAGPGGAEGLPGACPLPFPLPSLSRRAAGSVPCAERSRCLCQHSPSSCGHLREQGAFSSSAAAGREI